MKKFLALLLVLAMCLSCLAACVNTPQETDPVTDPPTDPPTDPWAGYTTITIAEALTLCEQFTDAPSTERYYIRGTVKEVQNDYGQMIVEDATGSIKVYGTYSADGSQRYSELEKKPVAGDEILLYATLQNYNGTTKEVHSGWIIDFVAGKADQTPSDLPADGTELTIAQLLALPISSGEVTTQKYTVRATVQSISNAQYGSMVIEDATGSISVYNSKNADGSLGYTDMEDKPYKGDSVVLQCTVQNFNGTMEIKQAYIVSFEHADITINPEDYTQMTIHAAREAEKGTKVQVSGVVARITYANGMIPSGVILVDGTDSIYVYDGDLAARVAIGNTISIYASKTWWILDTETSNASKFGYKGCNQLEDAVLISNDNGNAEFDKSWVQTTTVKEIMDTPVTEDITSKIFKVTAQIKEVPGTGFTNYYINDLDGTTGTYAYTQCNGGDFEWLRAYDGKIVTVYVVALNAKSTASDCYWRFLPVAVVDEGFDVSSVNVAEHVVKYYGVIQFLSTYTGNPELKLQTEVNSDLLNFKGAKLSYTSSDTSVISIDNGVMNCHKSGTVQITVTGSYNGKTYSEKVTITVKIADKSDNYSSVSDAINANVGDTVTVKGIVGPSLVNQTGFYLIDETGVIAVRTTADVLATLKIGYEVVLQGERYYQVKEGTTSGQTCLNGAIVVSNNYGTHEYSTKGFKGDITVADFYNLSIDTDYTTSVYTMKATVTVEENKNYTNIYLTDGTNQVRLYCSSANQYTWLKAYAGQEVTVEIAACNWNSKSYYTGCVLAVVNADGTRVLNTLNFGN